MAENEGKPKISKADLVLLAIVFIVWLDTSWLDITYTTYVLNVRDFMFSLFPFIIPFL